jgi:AcrR family transcriptional regulator
VDAPSKPNVANLLSAVIEVVGGQPVAQVARKHKLDRALLARAYERFLESGERSLAAFLVDSKGPDEDRRSEIIWTAARLFGDRGYGSTRLEQVADAMGITRTALYYYFKTKDDLLVAVVQYALDGITGAFGGQPREDETLQDFLARCIDEKIRDLFGARLPFYRVYLNEHQRLPADVAEWIVRKQNDDVEQLSALLRRGMDDGTIRPLPSPTLLASTLHAALNVTARWFDPDRGDVEQLIATISTLVFDGISEPHDRRARAAPIRTGGRATRGS